MSAKEKIAFLESLALRYVTMLENSRKKFSVASKAKSRVSSFANQEASSSSYAVSIVTQYEAFMGLASRGLVSVQVRGPD